MNVTHWKVIVTNTETNESWQAYDNAQWTDRSQAQVEAEGIMKLYPNLKAEVVSNV